MFQNYPDVINVNQLAEMLGIGIVLAYKLVKNKYIQAKKVGREYKILKSAVMEFLQNTKKEEKV